MARKAVSAPKVLTKMPSNEKIWLLEHTPDGTLFVTTSNAERTQYKLYHRAEDGGYIPVAKAKTPAEFSELAQSWRPDKP